MESDEATGDAGLLRALGIDPATVVWPSAGPEDLDAEPARGAPPQASALADEEWQQVAPLLPPEAPQANAMSNRAFLETVLAAMQRGGAWTTRTATTAEIEPVRRRFGRWAHQGVFERLSADLAALQLSPDHKRLLDLACRRAASLRARAGRC